MKNTESSAANLAKSMSGEVLANSQGLNNVLTTGEVRAVFHTHFADMANGQFGIAALISDILRANGAEFKAGSEASADRAQVIGASMFTEQVFQAVVDRFTAGSCRYPLATIKTYLSVFMMKAGQVGKVQLTNGEDCERTCCKPRCKWYVVKP